MNSMFCRCKDRTGGVTIRSWGKVFFVKVQRASEGRVNLDVIQSFKLHISKTIFYFSLYQAR